MIKKLKDWVQCFSMQIVISKCFLLNHEKNLALIRVVFFREKQKKTQTLTPKNDVTDPKARLL